MLASRMRPGSMAVTVSRGVYRSPRTCKQGAVDGVRGTSTSSLPCKCGEEHSHLKSN